MQRHPQARTNSAGQSTARVGSKPCYETHRLRLSKIKIDISFDVCNLVAETKKALLYISRKNKKTSKQMKKKSRITQRHHVAADDSKCGRGCRVGGIFWGCGGGLPHRRRAGVMSGRATCSWWPRGTYIVLLPVKLQRVPQLSQLGLQI